MAACTLFLFLSACTLPLLSQGVRYEPNWASLDQRPLPGWYDDVKFGVFLHWGVFSVPGYGYPPSFPGACEAWFWWLWKGAPVAQYEQFIADNYPPGFTYADFAPEFKAEFFDPDAWADILQASGAGYVLLTSKHHEGFTNWPSKVSWNWNSMDVGPRRDLVGELAEAVRRKTNVHFGLYHSLFEWFNPLYLKDKQNNFTTQEFIARKTMPELYDLVNTYKPDIVWSDGEWEAHDTYWNSTEFIAWLYNDSPVRDYVLVNDRWGLGDRCKHGGYFTCDDRYNPGTLQNHKWENAMTVEREAWGYRRNAQLDDYLTIEELVSILAQTVSTGGNMVLNVGPTPDGRIPPIPEERLRQMGQWLAVNGEGIYQTKPWKYQNDTLNPDVWYTASKMTTSVYAVVLRWPNTDTLFLDAVTATSDTMVNLLGFPGFLSWTPTNPRGLSVMIPPIPIGHMPCEWGWVFKLQNIT